MSWNHKDSELIFSIVGAYKILEIGVENEKVINLIFMEEENALIGEHDIFSFKLIETEVAWEPMFFLFLFFPFDLLKTEELNVF